MDVKAAVKRIAQGDIMPVYVCYGPEKYRMKEFITFLTDALIEPEHRDFAVSTYDLAETSLDTVLDDAETLPFMVPRKLIIAKDAMFFTAVKDTSKAEHRIERLLEYVNAPVDYSVIVFTAQADKLDERKKLVKLMKEKEALVPLLPLGADELKAWLERQAQERGCTFGPGAADRLIISAGGQQQALSAEMEKLSLYAGHGGTITMEMVDSLVVRSVEQNVFLLIEEMVKLKLDQAFSIYYELLKQKEEPIKILVLISRQFRIMAQVKELSRQGYSQQQMAGQLGLHPYAVKLAEGQARKFEVKQLNDILARLADLDYEIKSGRIDKSLAVELFLIRLAA